MDWNSDTLYGITARIVSIFPKNPKEYRRSFQANFFSTQIINDALIPRFLRRKYRSAIVNLSFITAIFPNHSMGLLSTSIWSMPIRKQFLSNMKKGFIQWAFDSLALPIAPKTINLSWWFRQSIA